MIKEVTETSIIDTVLGRLKSEDMIILHANQFIKVLKGLLFGSVKFLANTKFDNEAALRISDKNGTFIAAVVLERSTDDEGKNSFEARFEVEEDSIKDITTIYELSDEEVQRFLNRFMYVITNNKFVNDSFTFKIFRCIVSSIINNLMNVSKNDVDEEGYEVKFEEFLSASIDDESGARVITFAPEIDLKKFIKDDKLVEIE